MSKSKQSKFRDALITLINMHSMENGSDTPDFILADYLNDCLKAWDRACSRRDKWYKGPQESGGTAEDPKDDPELLEPSDSGDVK